MITELSIKNFKGWADTGKIRLAPLTVFFGSNSSGKTSLLQFLMMLKQTAQSSDRKRVLHLGDKGTPVELGTFRDVVHGHDATRDIAFRVKWRLPKSMRLSDSYSGDTFAGSQLAFDSTIGVPETQGAAPLVRAMAYELHNRAENGNPVMRVRFDRITEGKNKGKYELSSERGYRFVYHQGRKWKPPAPIRFYGFPEEVANYYQNGDVADDFTYAMETFLGRVFYLGPLRGFPERAYTWSGERPEDVGERGERAIAAVLAGQNDNRKISHGRNCRTKPFLALAAHWLKELGIIADFQVREAPPDSQRYEVDAKVTPDSEPVSLKDVGFGVSQVLPVVVQCFYSPTNATQLLEQPEIHLHPSVQAQLADLFRVAIRARENGTDRNTQLVVESHSEHLLRRLQRLIAEEKLRKEEVALYFCSSRGGRSTLEEVEVDKYGNILNWPEDFFGDQMGEIAAMQRAQLQRRREEGGDHG